MLACGVHVHVRAHREMLPGLSVVHTEHACVAFTHHLVHRTEPILTLTLPPSYFSHEATFLPVTNYGKENTKCFNS